MRKTFAAVLSAVAAWLLLLSMLLMGVFVCTTSTAFYRHEYQKYGQAQAIGIEDEELMDLTHVVLDYLWGSRDTLDLQMQLDGGIREVFSQLEKDHMVDVKELISLARIVMVGALAGGAMLWALGYLLGKKEKGGVRASGIGYLVGELLLIVGIGVFVLLCLQDFTEQFVVFHEIFFDGGWMLNATDMLIMMFPENFFADCALLILVVFGVGALLTAIGAVMMVVLGGRDDKQDDDAQEDWTLTAVSGSNGDNYYKIEQPNQESQESRPDADEIFAAMGLDNDDDDDEEGSVPLERLIRPSKEPAIEPETVMGYEEPLPYSQIAAPTAAPIAAITGDLPLKIDDENVSVRFEMRVDLKVQKDADGQMLLVMDPDCRPQVSLSSRPGLVSFAVAPSPELAQQNGDASQLLGAIETVPDRVAPIVEPAPTPDELLRQMDCLMQGYPKADKDEEEGQ